MTDSPSNNSRRSFIKTVAAVGRAMAAGNLFPGVAEAITPSVDSDLRGVIDCHVHADPDEPFYLEANLESVHS